MEFEFTLKGRPRRVTRERVIEALRDVPPEPRTPHMVVIEGTAYPVKQAFSETFGVQRTAFSTTAAQQVFERLGFEVTQGGVMEPRPRPFAPPRLKRPIFQPGKRGQDLVQQVLDIPSIILNWSYLERWEDIVAGGEGSEEIDLPPKEPGVYEVHAKGQPETLYIGRASNLMRRVCYGLVGGTDRHPAGQKIRENEEVSTLTIRWAVTDRPAAAEEELHRQHIDLFGRLPKYTSRT